MRPIGSIPPELLPAISQLVSKREREKAEIMEEERISIDDPAVDQQPPRPRWSDDDLDERR